ncbi:hypothetical protein KC19_3G227500 [Ceratodon purpureus]|uniref:Uncharacterized protein n=1 Tax=Ceratodon purpureus TaxID=3225 RepID=A0A8T0IPD8_CERPU|nr:hypothetical protein KC19_3G227500 [Ceratodon purpureus]
MVQTGLRTSCLKGREFRVIRGRHTRDTSTSDTVEVLFKKPASDTDAFHKDIK